MRNAPYVLWGSPRGDVQISAVTSGANTSVNLSGSINLEAAYLTNDLFFSVNEQTGLTSLRWTGGRTSPAGNAFGLTGVHTVRFGDISGQSLPLIGSARGGRGLFLSTAPLNRPSLFDTTQLQGNALPGWDVELYRDGSLIDFKTVGENGRYNFEEIPLTYGSNALEVVLYGPQGQIERREFRQNVMAGQMKPGEIQLTGSILNTGSSIIELRESSATNGERINLRADYGISQSLTIGAFADVRRERVEDLRFASSSDLESLDKEHVTMQNIGLIARPSLAAIDTEFVGISQNQDEYAVAGSARFSTLGLNFSGNLAHFSKGFVSDIRRSGGSGLSKSEFNLRVDRSLGRFGSVDLDYRKLYFDSGSATEEWVPRWRHRLFGTSVSHTLRLSKRSDIQTTRYRLLGSMRWGDLSNRFQLLALGRGFNDLKINELSVSTDYRWDSNRSIGLTTRYALASDSVSFSGRFSQQWGLARLSASASVNQTGTWSAGLTLSVGLGSRGTRPLTFLPPQNVRGGALEVNVFQDLDGDGLFSGNDRPVEGVTVAFNERSGETLSDKNGQLLALGLPTRRSVEVELDIDSLPDPFLTTSQPRVRFTPRPGYTHRIDMPLQDSAFVSGEISQQGRPVIGLEVTARRIDGLAKENFLSLSGGYFGFERLAPGEWEIFVDQESLPEDWQSTRAILEIKPGASVTGVEIELLPPAIQTEGGGT